MKDLKNKSVLDLSNKGLTEIPDWVFQETKLKRLLLAGNNLHEIPKQISLLGNLEVLDISGNKITQLQSCVCKLSKLKVLVAANNSIKKIPKQVVELSKLRILLLNGNKIKDLPDEFNLLEKLFELNLSNNLLETIPIVLHHMPNLKKIWINYNYIPMFSLNHFSSLKYVKHVSYETSKKRLEYLPKEEELHVKVRRNTFIVDTDSDNTGLQGSCFYLKDIGVVTCEHVLEGNQIIHNSHNPSQKYKFKVIKKHAVMDLAILYVEGMKLEDGLEMGKFRDFKLDTTNTIYCFGYSNYRVGDSGIFQEGKITGHRTVSTFDKWLVNIPLIGGSSGGPALNAFQKTVGVIITGADRMENANKTEDHGVLKIRYIRDLMNTK